jgi:hypothetical protein
VFKLHSEGLSEAGEAGEAGGEDYAIEIAYPSRKLKIEMATLAIACSFD